MESAPGSAASGGAAAVAPDTSPAATETHDASDPSPPSTFRTTTAATDPPLSKNQLKKRRRWERSQAHKRLKKEKERELKRLKAEKAGRNLDEERKQQLRNEREGTGWKKREEKWQQIVKRADVDNSFRVCFDCAFEDEMNWKESNSLSLQLRYTYAMNRKSTMPVHIDVCGMKRGGVTWEGLEKVEGFPDKWVGRAFRCYEEKMEEVYAKSVADNAGNAEAGDAGGKEEVKEDQESGKGDLDDAKDAKDGSGSAKQSHPKLRPNHQFVYLSGDSPNTLSTLDDNTTYIIGGIVDRNRLKRAAIQRTEGINAEVPSLDIKTARLPLDENFDFKQATRILTCNHVFMILQKYRENGYKDWKAAIAAVLPERKDIEERKDDEGGAAQEKEGRGCC
ncbi:hypothetical protein ACHAXT_005646 [Thalassiosira profunda]